MKKLTETSIVAQLKESVESVKNLKKSLDNVYHLGDSSLSERIFNAVRFIRMANFERVDTDLSLAQDVCENSIKVTWHDKDFREHVIAMSSLEIGTDIDGSDDEDSILVRGYDLSVGTIDETARVAIDLFELEDLENVAEFILKYGDFSPETEEEL